MVDDRLYCQPDFEVINGLGIRNNVFIIFYKKLEDTGSCSGCGSPVGPDDTISIGDMMYHHTCLNCCICGDNLEGKQVTLDNQNKIYCSADYER